MNPRPDTAVCIGTGPSLTLEQIDVVRSKGYYLAGCNNAYQIVPDLSLLYAVNMAWWDHYWSDVKDHPCEKWSTKTEARDAYGVNQIDEQWGEGLSKDPSYIHHGHGSGYSLLGVLYRKGFRRFVLLGYDMRYSSDYNGKAHDVGSTPRHYFGEYPASMQHWPSVRIEKGVHLGLLDLYATVAAQDDIEVLNSTPGSALECFRSVAVEDL